MEDLKRAYPVDQRNVNHKYKTNNWLKMHKKPMRRKPFKKLYLIMDEAYKLFDETVAKSYVVRLLKK